MKPGKAALPATLVAALLSIGTPSFAEQGSHAHARLGTVQFPVACNAEARGR